MNNIIGLSPKALRKAADIQEKISVAARTNLNQLLGGEISNPVEATEARKKSKKRKMSAAGRAAIAAAAKARWAKIKGTAPKKEDE